ncbi:hypothetical protein PFLUV_G00169140 [Perca fluviatilis]|uniref:Serine protease n=1 Tax=Perca fluviatilis TaxID=8168 RepID=A0A6A5EER4_PERFL|nr:hypothetical protein PFLUV_G00169140 [Perca fluviatilis]
MAEKHQTSSSQARVKEESHFDRTVGHLHHFTVTFSSSDSKEYAIDCDQPRTVLEVIKSTEQYGKKMKSCPDENVVIQLDTIGGKYTKQKKRFVNNVVKEFKYLCVYGEKGMTVKEALKRDGRFVDDLGNFTLTDNKNPKCITEQIQKVDNLDNKKFKICLPRKRAANDSSRSSNNSPQMCDPTPAVDEAQQRKIRAAMQKRGISVRAAIEKSGNSVDIEEIYEILRRQSLDLKTLLESRFPGDSYQKAVNLRKENFGKIQQSFSEVHRVRKLLKLGQSVCKVVVGDVQGTGFVLFDDFILTNAHIFKGFVEGQTLKEGTDVSFFFEDPESKQYHFKLAHPDICYSEGDLDYAIFKIMPVGENYNHTTRKITQMKVPPGLLKIFGPMPWNGEACIIGHPAGGVKKMDLTFIIEKEKREHAVLDHLHPYKESIVTIHSICHLLKDQGIENIMMGGRIADKVVTYHTFMYHGSSGSPVFNARGRVFGLHTAGYAYQFQNSDNSVIEFAQPLLTIFKHFVSTLKGSGKEKLLERVKKVVKGNPDLEKIFKSVVEPADPEELLDIEPMDFN